MRTRTAILGASMVAAAAACSLTTPLDGLSTSEPAVAEGGAATPDAGDATVDAGDATVDGGSAQDAGSVYRATVLADSPLAYFRFDDTGTVAKDETGAHDGTYKGAATHVAGAIAAEPSTAAVFDGSSYVDVGDVLPFTGTAPFTLEAWASPLASAADPQCIVAKTFAPGGATGGVADGYTLYVQDATNALRLARFVSSTATGPDGPKIANQRFTHVVATYDGKQGALFVDGSPVATGASPELLVSVSSPFTIGAGRAGVYCYFHGALDEVAIYGVALPAERILAHYVAGTAK